MDHDAELGGTQNGATAKKADAQESRRPRGTGAAYVYDSLKGQILDLVLSPGTLLDETDLSKQLGVSRSPVREALIRLAAEGLVHTLRNRTSIVAHFDIAHLPAYFDAMQLIYRLTARLAAGRPDPAKVEVLRRIQADHEAAIQRGDMRAIVRFNRDFHTAIADMSGNEFFANWMRSLLDQGQRILRLYAHHRDDQLPLEVLTHHREMIESIERGDPDAAERAGREDANVLVREFQSILSDQSTSALSLNAASSSPGGRGKQRD